MKRIDDSIATLCDATALALASGVILPDALALAVNIARTSQSKDSSPSCASELQGLEALRASGLSFSEALNYLSTSTKSEPVRKFCLRLQFAVKMGHEIGSCLDAIAMEERNQARHRWEERIAKLPILMLFPIAFALLPSLFIFLASPSIIELMDGTSQSVEVGPEASRFR